MSQRISHRGSIASIVGFVSLLLLSVGTTAKAAMVELDFAGAAGNNSGGVYVYPYNFNFNGTTTPTVQLMCDDFNHEIMAPQDWEANAISVGDLNNANVENLQFPGIGVEGYLEVAYLFEEEVSANATNSDPLGLYNWAAWDLTDSPNDPSGSHLDPSNSDPTDEATVQGYLAAAEAAGPGLTPSQFSNVIIYTPTPSEMTPGGPQEFLGTGTPVGGVPEPTTFALLGIGAMGLLGRRRRSAASV
jgi:hypothetical protein